MGWENHISHIIQVHNPNNRIGGFISGLLAAKVFNSVRSLAQNLRKPCGDFRTNEAAHEREVLVLTPQQGRADHVVAAELLDSLPMKEGPTNGAEG
jgi:hypothetical protein